MTEKSGTKAEKFKGEVLVSQDNYPVLVYHRINKMTLALR